MKRTKSNLTAWLTDPRASEFFGTTFAMRCDALAYLLTGTPLQREIAERHQCGRTAVTMAVLRAKKVFGISKRHGS